MVDIDAVLARMTLDEKLAQLGCVWCTALVARQRLLARGAPTGCWRTASARSRASARPPACDPANAPRSPNAIQRHLVEQTRLGIPAIVHEESTAGLCARDATQFPQAIGLASTWDPDLVGRIGAVIRAQMVATGARHTLAPVLDVARDPRWGRVEETYGESAYLASRLGVAYVRGRAGRSRERRRGDRQALPRLRALGGRPEPRTRADRAARAAGGRGRAVPRRDRRSGPRHRHELLRARSTASPCGGSKAILDDLLRGELGFGGAVVADYSTTELLMSHHRIAAIEGRGRPARARGRARHGAPAARLLRRAAARARRVGRGRRRARRPFRAARARAQGRARALRRAVRRRRRGAARAYGRPADRALAREAAVEVARVVEERGRAATARDRSSASP